MSVVPYSNTSDTQVILSLPTSNSLILYNKLNNSLEVIKNIKDHREPSPETFTSSRDIECPNCGYHIHIEDDLNETESDHIQKSHSGGSGHAYIDNDYFKLLQLNFLANSDNSIKSHQRFIDNQENQYIRLSDSLFTQGYFENFFKILKKIGTGSNGSVYKVEHLLNDLVIGVFALKKIGIGEDLNNLANILKEVQFLYNLTNGDLYGNIVEPLSEDEETNDLLMAVDGARHLIKYNHVWLEIDNASTFGPKIPCVFILFEYCDGGDLENFINNKFNFTDINLNKLELLRRRKSVTSRRKFLNNFEIFKIFKDICFGVYQLHKCHIIHRDLKPSNCLLKQVPKESFILRSVHDLEKFPDVVVSDFGESAIEGTKRDSSGYTGTLEFTSPELLFQNADHNSLNNFNKKTDVYSMGLILYFLCFNKLPYQSSGQENVRHEIELFHDMQDVNSFLYGGAVGRDICDEIDNDNFENGLLVDFTKLIEMMCDVNPERRPSVDEIILFLVQDLWIKLELYTNLVDSGERRSSIDTITLSNVEKPVDITPVKEYPAHTIESIIALILVVCSLGVIDWKYVAVFLLGATITHIVGKYI